MREEARVDTRTFCGRNTQGGLGNTGQLNSIGRDYEECKDRIDWL
ncbi:unnamed protein product [marine sediment metagenome]|uniref:Uncharacterized protein n=1 Tax=marine sediment metagenome TaxID=412755 RepID=X1KEE7_9ZZZZ